MAKPKIVLAYSGGLDTSVILKWLDLKGYDVIAYVADVGQEEDFAEVERRALATGASKVIVADLKREFVTDYIFPALRGRAVYEDRYLLGTALARPIIAKRQIEIALEEGATLVSHGATGKGNDQVRFELTYAALGPNIGVFAPWKDPEFLQEFQGRPDMIAFAKANNIDIPVTLDKPFSTDENLMHKSYESGVLEDPDQQPDKDIFTMTLDPTEAPDAERHIDVHFKDGNPIKIVDVDNGQTYTDPLELFTFANRVGRENAIGRVDIVENRFIGIKSRGIYETPGGAILYAALRDLEGIAMDKEVRRLRDKLAPDLAAIIYNGFWFSPEMDFLMGAIEKSQELIDGVVRLRLYKGNIAILGRSSPTALYDPEQSSMDVAGGFDQTDSVGFIRINALRLKAHRLILKKVQG